MIAPRCIRETVAPAAATGLQLALGPCRQGEQIEQRIKIGLTAELFQTQPAHLLLQEHPQGFCGAEVQAAVRGDHQHRPVHHLRVLLQEAVRLRGQPVMEAGVAVHLHLQQHHRELRAAGLSAAGALSGPEHTIETVVQLLLLLFEKASPTQKPAARALELQNGSGDRRDPRARDPRWRCCRPNSAAVHGSGLGRFEKRGNTSGRCSNGAWRWLSGYGKT